jgi:hypothetical protein
LRAWLYNSTATVPAKVDTIHTEPLHLVAMFLGIDETTKDFARKIGVYSKWASTRGWRASVGNPSP